MLYGYYLFNFRQSVFNKKPKIILARPTARPPLTEMIFINVLRSLSQAVCPDLAKFRHFGKILQVFGKFLKA